MEKIYVASSWRNKYQPEVVSSLQAAGYEVYDFRNPAPNNHGFAWSEISLDWKGWDTAAFIEALDHPVAEKGFMLDYTALLAAPAVVLVLPCGRSAHLEAGYAAGMGKPVIIYSPEVCEPELMYLLCSSVVDSIDGVLAELHRINQ